ncbi:LANO_0A04654g1_1 [Lachancea nothofagi CBS 11611]|uniref:LANO_0A04654g1_1 n=1 Tax=Lachancea nothofagi CBS 11611 TaxID=1266666 RepID=A0A1G4IQY5_9SACH|nr:LANO_0A04654g1_1 [Lachancea nothofagi CBS 11611]
MSSSSFTKRELIACLKASSKWVSRDYDVGSNIVDLIEPTGTELSSFEDPEHANNEPQERINHLIGKHILKTKKGYSSWDSYIQDRKRQYYQLCYANEPESLYFVRRTRSLKKKKV